MKRLTTLFIALLLTVSLFGCGKTKDNPKNASVNGTSKATIATTEEPHAEETQEITSTPYTTDEIEVALETTTREDSIKTQSPQTQMPQKNTQSTNPPTKAPTNPPTKAPTNPPTKAPTNPPTQAPVKKLTLPNVPLTLNGFTIADKIPITATITKLEYDSNGNLNVFARNDSGERQFTISYKIYDADGVVITNSYCLYKLANGETGKSIIYKSYLTDAARIEFTVLEAVS